MRVHVEVSGHYAWEPLPPGTEVTKADLEAEIVREMHDGTYSMKVERSTDTYVTCSPHESSIAARFAALEHLRKAQSRAQVAYELTREALRHEIDERHMVALSAADVAPSEVAIRLALADLGTPADRVEAIVARYMAPGDLSTRLAAMFGVPVALTPEKSGMDRASHRPGGPK